MEDIFCCLVWLFGQFILLRTSSKINSLDMSRTDHFPLNTFLSLCVFFKLTLFSPNSNIQRYLVFYFILNIQRFFHMPLINMLTVACHTSSISSLWAGESQGAILPQILKTEISAIPFWSILISIPWEKNIHLFFFLPMQWFLEDVKEYEYWLL